MSTVAEKVQSVAGTPAAATEQMSTPQLALYVSALLHKEKKAEAVVAAQAALARPDLDQRSAGWIQGLLSQNVPQFHRTILTDQWRNDVYDAALRRAIGPGDHVLDIGTGSGLLAMMAARAGAGRVIACEMNPVTAALAESVIAANGYADRIQVVARHSKELELGRDLERPVDVIVSEIVSNTLVGQNVLEVHRDGVGRLLRPGGRVIPGRIAARVALGYNPDQSPSLGTVSGFDLRRFDPAVQPVAKLKPGHAGLEIRSSVAELFAFDLEHPDSWQDMRARVTVQPTGAPVNVLLQWLHLTMDPSGAADAVYENRPQAGLKSCWAVLSHRLHGGVWDAPDAQVAINGLITDDKLSVWLDGPAVR
ncbi:50S ribosomal protein L11 methyltransferase [Oleisolibacter albus]|uniref:50S ribosomal protein L11 methyltransferase n=1 Tax=Oleisolibacter albus TaxID=2171757 RepID=UPI00138FEF0A|nr:50S ribosomal protein L11 methyltransferase [Oleisolibacter albus]